jgi:putative FmdB family regulatory protein
MPTYEYKCDNGHPYSEVRSISEDDKVSTCKEPECELQLKRVFTAPPISFKGGGFATSHSPNR